MIKEFAGSRIWTEDVNNLLPFYRDVLGIKVTMEGPDFVLLGGDRPDQSLLGLGTHSEVHGKNNDPARHMVAFTSDNVEADWKRLKDAGVEFIQDPTTY